MSTALHHRLNTHRRWLLLATLLLLLGQCAAVLHIHTETGSNICDLCLLAADTVSAPLLGSWPTASLATITTMSLLPLWEQLFSRHCNFLSRAPPPF